MDDLDSPRLAVDIYQLADDQLFLHSRRDGAGWDWGWADLQRDWMNATPFRHAYRCLPLTIVNQTGWWVKNPVSFTATWSGSQAPGSIRFEFESADPVWGQWINSQFGEGIITWNTPFLFRTKPAGSRLLVMGPTNYFRKNAHPLTALIESDWMTMSFTMNYKLMTPLEPVRFAVGEPLFQVIPLVGNVCADLEDAEVRYQRLADDPAVYQDYLDWSTGRANFHKSKAKREVRGDQWQKDYFHGRDGAGREVAVEHKTKVKAPRISYGPPPGGSAEPDRMVGAATAESAPARASAQHDSPPPARRHRPVPRRAGRSGADSVVPEPKSLGLSVNLGSSGQAGRPLVGACPMGFGPGAQLAGLQAGATAVAVVPARSVPMEQEVPMKRMAKLPRRVVPQPGAVSTASRSGDSRHRIDPGPPGSRMDDNYRRWIAENLLLGSPPEMIQQALIGLGLDPAEVAAEIHQAVQSPYLSGAVRLQNRLKKRDWLLATYRKLNRLHPDSQVIPRKHRPSRAEFLAEHYSTNRPVIITGMIDDWPALRKWDLDYFATNFGGREVEVQLGRNSGENYEVEREKYIKKVQFGEFVRMVRTAGRTNDFYLTANNNSSNKQTLPELWGDLTPITEYLEGSDPTAGFFWMGPSGTITPFHHDLTNNFMAQVIGRKRILLAPSWDVPLMGNDLHVFSKLDGRGLAAQSNPPNTHPQIIECIIEPGEILFLPIGCWHYVEGLDISVTMTFTNFVFDNDFTSFYSTYHQV